MEPLCSRWAYKFITASYGYVHNKKGQLNENQNLTEESWQWSRIRIFFPEASYLLTKEEPPMPLYVALCNVGGSMTMYCGVSMISFVQVIIYGGFVLYMVGYKYWRNRQIL